VYGSVNDAAAYGAPFNGATVDIYSTQGGAYVLDASTLAADGGAYAFPDMPDGSYEIVFSDPSGAYAQKTVSVVVSGGDVEVPAVELYNYKVLSQPGIWPGSGVLTSNVAGPSSEFSQLWLSDAEGTGKLKLLRQGTDYTIHDGAGGTAQIVFTASYLASLAPGTYSYLAAFYETDQGVQREYDAAPITLTIPGSPSPTPTPGGTGTGGGSVAGAGAPQTGDMNAIYSILASICLTVLGILAFIAAKRRREDER
jgi:LPXTG-motif cell wall-anchored protein